MTQNLPTTTHSDTLLERVGRMMQISQDMTLQESNVLYAEARQLEALAAELAALLESPARDQMPIDMITVPTNPRRFFRLSPKINLYTAKLLLKPGRDEVRSNISPARSIAISLTGQVYISQAKSCRYEPLGESMPKYLGVKYLDHSSDSSCRSVAEFSPSDAINEFKRLIHSCLVVHHQVEADLAQRLSAARSTSLHLLNMACLIPRQSPTPRSSHLVCLYKTSLLKTEYNKEWTNKTFLFL